MSTIALHGKHLGTDSLGAGADLRWYNARLLGAGKSLLAMPFPAIFEP